jgi:hypothetical protein
MSKETMKIFRAAEAPLHVSEAGSVTVAESSQQGLAKVYEAGMADGFVLKTLFEGPGFALHYVWFKANYLLGRHSHNLDALYYIVAGSLQIGDEWLGAGDGIFLPADTQYVYTVGPEGVELLEFRHDAHFTTFVSGASQAFWDRALETVRVNREAWLAATPPRPARLPQKVPVEA